ncbi:MAG: 50S ribosomal protein L9 [Opitutae bacterium]|nr:50S ribosomal protein L9 [Opitutae bacterium]
MATANVLLIDQVEGLGAEGDEAKVRAGYARNYLIPQKLAIPLTKANRKRIESLKRARALRETNEIETALALKAELEDVHIAIQAKIGQQGKMFGAVTARDLYDHIAAEGVEIDRDKIQLYNPIKTMGKHVTRIKLHPEVGLDFEFEVVPAHDQDEPVG